MKKRSNLLSSLRKLVFGIAAEETSFAKRGFRAADAAKRQHLEAAGGAFVSGYRAALDTPRSDELVEQLEHVGCALRGFAFEGAAMGLALQDWLTPWNRSRVRAFLAGAGDAHAYMVHVGAGWVMARVPGTIDRFLSKFDPLLRWLLVDGYGFHEGFFHSRRSAGELAVPKRVHGYARRAFDQGLGRCLWFAEGADVSGIAQRISEFSLERRADLWSGAGLAATYAGEISRDELYSLCHAAGPFLSQAAQGAAFAAKARQRAENLTPYQDTACHVLCGMSAAQAAAVTDGALENLPSDGAEPAYEIWRRRIQQRFVSHLEEIK